MAMRLRHGTEALQRAGQVVDEHVERPALHLSATAPAIEFPFALDELPTRAEHTLRLTGLALVAHDQLRAALQGLPLARDGDEVGAKVEHQVVLPLRILGPHDEATVVASVARSTTRRGWSTRSRPPPSSGERIIFHSRGFSTRCQPSIRRWISTLPRSASNPSPFSPSRCAPSRARWRPWARHPPGVRFATYWSFTMIACWRTRPATGALARLELVVMPSSSLRFFLIAFVVGIVTKSARAPTRQRTFALRFCCSGIDAPRAACGGESVDACAARRCGSWACQLPGVGCGSGFEICRRKSDQRKKVCESKIKAVHVSRTARACSAFHGPSRDSWAKSGSPDFSLGAPRKARRFAAGGARGTR